MGNSLAARASRLFGHGATNLDCVELLNYIARSARSMTALWHPLGFVNLELGALKEDTYRLHIWPQHERRPKTPDWRIHTHLYDLESFVVKGSITDRRYSVEIAGNTSKWLYEVRYKTEGSVLTPLCIEVEASLERESTHSTYQRYTVPQGLFHSSEVELETLAVTIVKLTNVSRARPLVVGDACDEPSSFTYKQDAIPPDLLESLLTAAQSDKGR